MMQLSEWLSFVAIALTITVSPGPGSLLTLSIAATRGPRPALISAAGLVVGAGFYIFLIVALFSTLLAGRPALTAVVMLLGGVYLLKLAVDSWYATGALGSKSRSEMSAISKLIATGALVSLGNAKLIALLVAFLPAFAGPEPSMHRAALLSISYVFIAFLWHSVLAFAGKVLGSFLTSTRGVRSFRRMVSCVFVLFGGSLMAEAILQLVSP